MGWVKLFMRKRADLNRKNFEQMSVNQNNLMQLIYGMQDIKLLGCEQQKSLGMGKAYKLLSSALI